LPPLAIQTLQTFVAFITENPTLHNVAVTRAQTKQNGARRSSLPEVAAYRTAHRTKFDFGFFIKLT
jgi:hypothetical protein